MSTKRTNRRFQLLHAITRYILANANPQTLLTYIAIGLHADRNTGTCYPSRETLARLIGLRDVRIITRCVAKLCKLGLVEKKALGFRKWELRIVRTDAKRDYLIIDDRFLQGYVGQEYEWQYVRRGEPIPLLPHFDGIGIVGVALFALLSAIGNGRREFTTSVKAIVELSGLSRGTVDAAMDLMENFMLIETRTPAFGQVAVTIVRPMHALLTPCPHQSNTLPTFTKDAAMGAKPSQNAHPVIQKPSQTTHPELDKDLNPNCTKALEANSTRATQDQRRSADAAETNLPFPISDAQEPDEPPTHDNCECIDGVLLVTDANGHTSAKQCKHWRAWVKWQKAAKLRAQAAFSDAYRPAPALPVIPPAPAPARQHLAPEVIPPAMYRELHRRIEIETGIYLDDGTRRRIDGMLQAGRVARYGPDQFHRAMRDVQREQWELKHGNCHDHGEVCDGTCGCDRDECDGYPEYIDSSQALDLVGCAVYVLTGDERFGRDPNTNCPNPIYQRMYGLAA